MKSAIDLKNLDQGIKQKKVLLNDVLDELSVLDAKQGKSKDDTKHQAKLSKFKWNLIYQIRGMQLSFDELKEKVIDEILSS